MSTFGEDLIQSLSEALAHAQGEGPAVVHAPVDPPRSEDEGQAHPSADGPYDGYELERLSQVGATSSTR